MKDCARTSPVSLLLFHDTAILNLVVGLLSWEGDIERGVLRWYASYMRNMVLAALVGTTLGVVLRSLYTFGFILAISLVFITVGIALLSKILGWQQEWVYTFCILLFFVAVGLVRMDRAIPTAVSNLDVGKYVTITGTVVAEPDARDTYTNLTIQSKQYAHRILIRTNSLKEFQYADTVRVSGVMKRPENFTGDTGRVFHYSEYLAKNNIYYLLPSNTITILTTHTTFRGELFTVKKMYLHTLQHFISEPYAALGGGITVGAKRSLGKALTEKFRESGIIHIVVLSGYNIAIMMIALSFIFSFLSIVPRSLFSIVVIAVFTLFVGASATVVRAAIMGSIGALGIMMGRSYSALHALLLAGVGMILWNPFIVVYDPSFQLSFVATLGLLLASPYLLEKVSWIPAKFGLRQLTVATIATQISVLPLLVYLMGQVSVVALPVNLLTLPLIPPAMLFVFVTGVLGMVSTILVIPFAYIAQAMLWYVTTVVTVATSFSWASFRVPSVSFSFIIGAYVVIGIWWWYIRRDKIKP